MKKLILAVIPILLIIGVYNNFLKPTDYVLEIYYETDIDIRSEEYVKKRNVIKNEIEKMLVEDGIEVTKNFKDVSSIYVYTTKLKIKDYEKHPYIKSISEMEYIEFNVDTDFRITN